MLWWGRTTIAELPKAIIHPRVANFAEITFHALRRLARRRLTPPRARIRVWQPSSSPCPSGQDRVATTAWHVLAASSPSPPPPGLRSARRGLSRYAAWQRRLPESFWRRTSFYRSVYL